MLSQFENKFEFIKSIGVGATSEVFEAQNRSTGETVALKAFSNIVLADSEVISRIQDETQALQSIHHPNVVRLIAQHRGPKFFGLELEFVDGTHLGEWLKSYDIALIEPKLWILAQVARGLGAAHEQGILHRDLKPENILVSHDGEVKITDFGLARSINRMTMTKLGLLVGSLGYMAPEVIAGQKASEQSDVFSLGALAYELIVGQQAFSGDSPQEVIRKIAEGKKPSFEGLRFLPREVIALIEKCLEVNPHNRPSTVWDFEAVMMGVVLKSGLAPHCRKLVSHSRLQVLREALEIKHQRLLAEAETSDDLIRVVADLQRLFPEEKKIAEILQGLRVESVPRKRKWPLLVVLLFLFAIPIANYFLVSHKSVPDKMVESETPKTVIAEPIITPPAAKPVRAKSDFGTIHFIVDPDVQVYLDDVLVPPALWKSFSAKVGTHRVKLVKTGFLPLESFVKVNPDKVTVVNAMGGQ